jgi:hypothetical protein
MDGWRANLNNAIRMLWSEFRDASDGHREELTDLDLSLWLMVTKHPAIQDRSDEARKG